MNYKKWLILAYYTSSEERWIWYPNRRDYFLQKDLAGLIDGISVEDEDEAVVVANTMTKLGASPTYRWIDVNFFT